MMCLRLVAACLLLCPATLLAADELFEFKPVADGVYAALAKPAFRTNCNAAIVLLDEGVLVVDTESKPSAARAVIAEIKKLTDKPVKYVVITHFHGDHSQGIATFLGAWPGAEVISTEATRESIEKRGIARMKRETVTVPQQIEKLKGDLEKATDAKEKGQIQENIRQAEAYVAELKQMQLALPTRTFDQNLTLHGQSQNVEILWLGKAHTDGDAFVYLPKEKVIVTGDTVHGFIPNMGDSSPYDWIRTLEAAERLDFDYIIGGHGDVQRGKGTIELWRQYFTDVLAETGQAFAEGATLDDARKRVAPILLAKYGGKFPAAFSQSVINNVEKAYRVVSGQTQ
jgi:cyclase